VQIVRRLTQRARDVGVFCNISGTTLTDSNLPAIPRLYASPSRSRGANHFRFSQESVLAAGSSEEANLRYLANLGFRLSWIVTKLDLDFARLKRLGFHFLKVRARHYFRDEGCGRRRGPGGFQEFCFCGTASI